MGVALQMNKSLKWDKNQESPVLRQVKTAHSNETAKHSNARYVCQTMKQDKLILLLNLFMD